MIAVLAGIVSAAGTWLLIRLNGRLGFTAAPRADRWHRQATPNSGGVAIFLSCALGYGIAFRGVHTAVALGTAAIWAVGFLDDRVRLRPAAKLGLQCAIAAAVVAAGVVFPATSWRAFNVAFSFLWIVGITNSFNLIDNMDGLCAGVAVIISAFRASMLAAGGYWTDAGLAAMLGAAFAGFLVFNYHPARIFMGDCGSMLAGFALAATTIASPLPHTKAFAAAVFYPALTFIYPIFDTVLVSSLRKAAGRPITVGGRDHSSHRLAYLGIGERRVVAILWGLTALGCAAGLATRWMPLEVIAAMALLVASFAMFGIFLSTLPPYQAKDLPGRHVPTLRAGMILVVDALAAGLALVLAFLTRYESAPPAEQLHNLLVSLPVVVLCHGALARLERTYEVPWRWFGLGDVARFGRAVVLGAALAYFGLWLLGVRSYPRGVMLLYCAWCVGLGLGLRMSLRALQDLRERPGAERERVGIFGAGAEGEMVATLLARHAGLNATPVVFLDSDRGKHGMRIRGIPVRCCENLRAVAEEFRLEWVALAGERDGAFERECAEAGVPLCVVEIRVRGVNGDGETGATRRRDDGATGDAEYTGVGGHDYSGQIREGRFQATSGRAD